MTDIVERLRSYARNCGGPPEEYLTWQAADEIERLCGLLGNNAMTTAEIMDANERLRAPFKQAAASDWDYLHRLLVTAVRSSEDQQTLFWLAVFKEARATYSKAENHEPA